MSGTATKAAAMSAALWVLVITGRGVDVSAMASPKAEARQAPQGLAEKLSGTWVLNRELSAGFAAPGRGRGRGGLQRQGARFAAANLTAAAQRGGGGSGDASDLTPAQRAEQEPVLKAEKKKSKK